MQNANGTFAISRTYHNLRVLVVHPKKIPYQFCAFWETTTGDSTCIFRQLNCRAKIGFESNTDMLRFLLLSLVTTAKESVESEFWHSKCRSLSLCSSDGLDTFAGDAGLTLWKKNNPKAFLLGRPKQTTFNLELFIIVSFWTSHSEFHQNIQQSQHQHGCTPTDQDKPWECTVTCIPRPIIRNPLAGAPVGT